MSQTCSEKLEAGRAGKEEGCKDGEVRSVHSHTPREEEEEWNRVEELVETVKLKQKRAGVKVVYFGAIKARGMRTTVPVS
eukprot:4183761-Amphidinium_carterae.2